MLPGQSWSLASLLFLPALCTPSSSALPLPSSPGGAVQPGPSEGPTLPTLTFWPCLCAPLSPQATRRLSPSPSVPLPLPASVNLRLLPHTLCLGGRGASARSRSAHDPPPSSGIPSPQLLSGFCPHPFPSSGGHLGPPRRWRFPVTPQSLGCNRGPPTPLTSGDQSSPASRPLHVAVNFSSSTSGPAFLSVEWATTMPGTQ